MLLNVRDVNRLIKRGEKVLLAVSGGLDSMCMLHAFSKVGAAAGIGLAAVTVNHNLRGGESDKDAGLVIRYCEENNIEYRCVSVNVIPDGASEGVNIEETARKLRYEAFCRVKEELGCDKIATAHHAGDNAETVLLNLFRGAGLRGASGIPKIRGGCIVRPLLSVTREELKEYAALNKIGYRDDLSNFDISYSRNYIRIEIMPLIKKRFPAAADNINRFAEYAGEDDKFIEAYVKEIDYRDGAVRVPLKYYKEKALSQRATRLALAKLGVNSDITARNYLDVERLAGNTKGKAVLLKHNITARRGYKEIIFSPGAEEIVPFEEQFRLGVTVTPYGVITAERHGGLAEPDASGNGAAKHGAPDIRLIKRLRGQGLLIVNTDIPKGAVWRNRRPGDMFNKFGGGTKKLNDYFTDIKLPDRERDTVPLLAAGDSILVIAGIEIAGAMRARDGGYITVKYENNESQNRRT